MIAHVDIDGTIGCKKKGKGGRDRLKSIPGFGGNLKKMLSRCPELNMSLFHKNAKKKPRSECTAPNGSCLHAVVPNLLQNAFTNQHAKLLHCNTQQLLGQRLSHAIQATRLATQALEEKPILASIPRVIDI